MLDIRVINEAVQVGLLDLQAFSQQNTLHTKREREQLGTQYLLKQLLKLTEVPLEYTPQRKPYLKGRTEHISISHSHDKLAVIVNRQEPTGIDIELIRDKIRNIQHKFLSDKELLEANNEVDKLLTYWAAKEALYKVYGLKEVEFRSHLMVEWSGEKELRGQIVLKDFVKTYRLAVETIESYKLVYVLHEI